MYNITMSRQPDHLKLGQNVQIHPTAEINVRWLEIGSGTIIGPNVLIEGTKVIIGREAWFDRGAYIGGGSCFDPCAYLVAGDFLHMGRNSHINTGRGVTIGDEIGCGVETKIFGHGAYLSELDGFPVKFQGITIGDRVWLPNAWVNPGVKIGNDVVVGARSLVNSDIPSGCLAAGIPCKVIRANCYPRSLSPEERKTILQRIIHETQDIYGTTHEQQEGPFVVDEDGRIVYVGETMFDTANRIIFGPSSELTRLFKNQLRRHGIRFKFVEQDGIYVSWEDAGY